MKNCKSYYVCSAALIGSSMSMEVSRMLQCFVVIWKLVVFISRDCELEDMQKL